MTHSDKEIATFFHQHEMDMTNAVKDLLIQHGFNNSDLSEKVHISLGLIDNLCHEIVYHKHDDMNYDTMIDLVINTIINILKK